MTSSFPTVSVIIPARDSVDLHLTLESLMRQTVQPLEILVVLNDRDITPQQQLSPIVQFLEVTPPAEFARDAHWKRHYGATVAKGDVLYFMDSKMIAEPDAIETALALMQRHVVSVIGGITPDWPTHRQRFLSLVQDKGLVMSMPEFPSARLLDKHNFGKAESLPVGGNLFMTRNVFESLRGDFGVEFSKYASSYDDYVLCWLIIQRGWTIMETNQIVSYHRHRLQLRELIRQISRSGQSAAVLTAMYPECPFGKRRTIQVMGIWLLLSIIMSLSSLFVVAYGFTTVSLLTVVSAGVYFIVGLLNIWKANDVRGFMIPICTLALVITFAVHFTKMLFLWKQQKQQFKSAMYLQIQ